MTALVAHIGAAQVTEPVDTTGATLIVIALGLPGNDAPVPPTDNLGNTYSVLVSARPPGSGSSGGGGSNVVLYYCLNPLTSTAHTFSNNHADFGKVGFFSSICVAAYSGQGAGQVDAAKSGGSAGWGYTVQPGSITPSAINELLISGFADGSTSAGGVQISPGWTILGQPANTSGGYPVSLAHMIQSGQAAEDPTWTSTYNNPNPLGAAIGAFQVGGSLTQPNVSVSPTSGSVTDGQTTLSITPTLLNSTAPLSASVSGGGTISTDSPVSGQPFTYTPPASGAGTATVTVTDVADGLSATCVISYQAQSGPLVAPALASSTITEAAVSFTYQGVSGGIAPYTTQLYRSTVSGFAAPAAGTPVGNVSANTADTLSDPSPPAGVNFYVAVTRDSNAAASASNQLPGAALQAPLAIGFIGDSITEGAGATKGTDDAVTLAAQHLSVAWGGRRVAAVNQGVGGSDTGNWQPGQPDYQAAIAAFAAAGVTVVHVMLGTNDAKTGSTNDYGAGITTIVQGLVQAGYKVIVSYPIYLDYTNPAWNLWNAQSLNRLLSFQPAIDALVDGVSVFHGDRFGWQYFADNRNLLPDGVHPGSTGYPYLAKMWAQAIVKALGW